VSCQAVLPKICGYYLSALIITLGAFTSLNNYFTSISDWGDITDGVPQGSILGPLLFLLYINDLSHSINKNNKIVLFADDTSLIISNPDPINFKQDIYKILQLIHEWFNANLISLNWEKTHFMHFTTKKISLVILT